VPKELAEHPDYVIKKELGRGGMGVVYLAHNTLMGRDEVLKVMGRHIIEKPGVLDRFLREIRAVARLRHPNIVTAYSASRLGESIVFAMEYVEGLDLARLVNTKGALPVAHACNFVAQAALGLQHAHEEGLVHRDIKPGNLMLARRADRPVIKVLDFGLAKASRESPLDQGLTGADQMLGTPAFIAPEQIKDAQSADIRADIYSLGCTLYYLLTGAGPFDGTSLFEILQAHVSADAQSLDLVRPDIPLELAEVVARMMAKDPQKRFQTPAEVAQALAPFKKGDATTLGTGTRVESLRPWNAGLTLPEGVGARTVLEPVHGSGKSAVGGGGGAIPPPPVLPPARRPWLWPALGAAGMLTLGLPAAWLGGAFGGRAPDPAKAAFPDEAPRTAIAEFPVEAPDQPKTAFRAVAPDQLKLARLGGAPDRATGGSTDFGFVPLFNGRKLAGLTAPTGKDADWVVRNGQVRLAVNGRGSSLATVRSDFADFHLRMEVFQKAYGLAVTWHQVNGPNGIRFYSFGTGAVQPDGTIAPLGAYKVKSGGGPGKLVGEDGLRGLTTPELAPLAKEAWHVVEIIALQNVFRMRVDGREVSAFQDTRSRWRDGQIVIRGGKDSGLAIRKIEIKELH
jgi:hypothetical protein